MRRNTFFYAVRVSIILILAGFCFSCAGTGGDASGLLKNRKVSRSEGVSAPSRLTDGVVPREGGQWKSNRTTLFSNLRAHADFDLGSEKKIDAIAVMADNNDTYEVAGSSDGKTYERLWMVPRVQAAGMRWRVSKNLDKKARHIRVRPLAGDASLSIAELSVFSQTPQTLPPSLKTAPATDEALQFRSAVLTAACLLLLAAAFMVQGGSVFFNGVLLLLALASVGHALWAVLQIFPAGKVEVSLVRAAAAAVAGGIVMRQAFSPKEYPPVRWFQISVLGFLGMVSVGAFYNLGHPQFFDHKNKEPSVVHNYDMRVYFPVAKYFDELKYDGLYLGSIASYAEEHGGLASPAIQRAELRDLRDHRMRKVSAIQPEVEAISKRFSSERWQEFKEDMRYFWETMGGRAYLSSMSDHGGNATPVWLSITYLMYGQVQASNDVLLWGAILDPLLLLVFAFFVYRSFGASTAFVSLVIFGANDFYMFGSNWAGATLRNDWMVYMGLGACALKSKRFRLGGALLALSALIRAFPAITLIALGAPALHGLVTQIKQKGKLPSWSEVYDKQRWFFDAAIGATLCVVICVVLSSSIIGWDSWPLWIKKISSFTSSPHVNHVSLTTVIGGSEGRQAEVLTQRGIFFGLTIALYVVLAIWVAAKSAPYRAALLGMMLMPIVMYPANYYSHFVFLLPLLVADVGSLKDRWQREAAGKTWIILLAICAAQYFTVKEQDLALHFYNASVLLSAGILAILVVLLPRDDEGRVDFAHLPFFGPVDSESSIGDKQAQGSEDEGSGAETRGSASEAEQDVLQEKREETEGERSLKIDEDKEEGKTSSE